MTARTLIEKLNYALYIVSALLILFIACMIIVDVVGRGMFNSPLTGTFEIVSNAIVLVAFLQLCYSIRDGGMFRATIVQDRLPFGGQRFLKMTGDLVGAIVFLLIVIASWHPMIEAWTPPREFFGGGEFRVVTYPVRSVIVFCSALAFANYVLLLWEEYSSPGSTLPKPPGTAEVEDSVEELSGGEV